MGRGGATGSKRSASVRGRGRGSGGGSSSPVGRTSPVLGHESLSSHINGGLENIPLSPRTSDNHTPLAADDNTPLTTDATDADDHTESSQRLVRGSSTTHQTLNHPSNSTFIIPKGKMFDLQSVNKEIYDIFKQMFDGCWPTWGKVPKRNRKLMWERFQGKFHWDPQFDVKAYDNWVYIIKKRYADLLRGAREEAEKLARASGLQVDDDMAVLKPYFPDWIDEPNWHAMIDTRWNTDKWKPMSRANKRNMTTLVDGQVSAHSGGSRSMLHLQLKMEKERGGPVPFIEIYEEYHTQMKSTSEEPLESKRYTTKKAENVWVKYKQFLVETYGPNETDLLVGIDRELWEKACGGRKKGRLFGVTKDFLVMDTSGASCSCATQKGPTTEEVKMLQSQVAEFEEREQSREAKVQDLNKQLETFARLWNEKFPPASS